MSPENSAFGGRDAPRVAVLTSILAATALVLASVQAPNQTFARFATLDSGGELAIQDMVRRGSRPGVDFGYPYGLLSLLVGRAWYGLAGPSPWSFRAYVTACFLLSMWGLARFAVHRRIGLPGLALLALAIPDLLAVTYLTSVHALEQALLIHALAEQARGRRGAALALLAACGFVKPSLAFVQGLAVLIAVVAASRRSGPRALGRSLLPPTIAVVVLSTILAAAFGPGSLASTLSPATGAAIYRAGHFGFFHGQGRAFWDLPNAGLRDYFRYEVGFWALGTTCLIAGGLAGAWRLARGVGTIESRADDEVILTCAAVHVAFVTLLFGHRLTWVYSLPMLVMGLAALSRRGRWHGLVVGALAMALLANDRSKIAYSLRQRGAESPSPITLGLWSSRQEREEWARALELTRGHRPALLAMCEGGAVLFPGFAPPVSGYLVPGNPSRVELRRKAEQLAEAPMIVAAVPPDWEGFRLWPELRAAFEGTELIEEGRSLRVYRRASTSSTRPSPPGAR